MSIFLLFSCKKILGGRLIPASADFKDLLLRLQREGYEKISWKAFLCIAFLCYHPLKGECLL